MFKWRLQFIALGLVTILSTSAHALNIDRTLSQYRLDVWGTRDGLPGYDITSLAQTPDGFMWVGTTAGLFRFDGIAFERYDKTNVDGLTSDLVDSLLPAKDGSLWVGTEWAGYGQLRGHTYSRHDHTGMWTAVHGLYQAPDGAVWASYESEVDPVAYRDLGGNVTSAPITGWYTSGLVADDPHDMVGIAMQGTGLYRLSADGKRTDYALDKPIPDHDLRCMIRRSDGSLCIGTGQNGIYVVRGRQWKHYALGDGLESNCVNCLYEDQPHRLLIGTDNGIDVWTPRGFSHFGPADGLGGYQVNVIMPDLEGNVWVAADRTLNRFADTAVIPITVHQGRQPAFERISPTAEGGLLCSTVDGLYRETSDPAAPPTQLSKLSTEGAVELKNGDILCWRPRPKSDYIYDVARLRGGKWWKLGGIDFPVLDVVDESEPITMIGYTGQTEQIGSHRIFKALGAFRSPHVFQVEHDRRGNAWIATPKGLICYRHGVVDMAPLNLPPNTNILSVDVSDPDRLWLGANHGLIRVDIGADVVDGVTWHNGTRIAAKLYTTSAGLPDNDILQVMHDDLGDVWAGGYFGIFSVPISDLDAYDRRQVRSVTCHVYTTADGIRAYPCVQPSQRSSDGTLWFEGTHGATCIQPNRLARNTRPPIAVVEHAVANGIDVSPNTRMLVAPGRGSFTATFAGLSFTAPDRVRYRYRLMGYDRAWISASRINRVNYTNLPPGDYAFEVRACNADGLWSSPAFVSFVLRPHFYETWWFKALGWLMAALAVWSLVLVSRRQLVKRAGVLEAKVAERTVELATAAADLQDRNDELEALQAELESQNDELTQAHAKIEAANVRLEALATTDGLTGLLNHRTFRERLEEEWGRTMRYDQPLSIVMLDVDSFKQYNDTYGHPAGDDVLRKVAALLAEHARDTDIVARYGGEEFIVLAPNTDAASAQRVAERLRSVVEAEPWPLRTVTGSFGVATTCLQVMSASDLIARADKALYESKRGGRNRVTLLSM